MKSPLYDGPLARALGGADLSWLLGLPVSSLVYVGLMALYAPRYEQPPVLLPAPGK